MKKLLFAACAMGALMFVACTQEGPSLVGTWNSEPVVKIDSAGANRTTNFKFELKEDSTLASDLDIVQDLDQDGVKITMPFKVAYKGKWSTADGKLIVTDEMVERLQTAIHQFAKRQMTRFRGMERKGIEIAWMRINSCE